MRINQVFLIFVDVSCEFSERYLSRYVDDIPQICEEDHYVMYLIANKVDMEWKVSKEKLQEFADKNKMKLYFTSIYDLNSVNSMFSSIVDDIMDKFDI